MDSGGQQKSDDGKQKGGLGYRMTRSSELGWREGAACMVLPVLLALALAGKRLSAVLAGGLIDPDSYMRLVRLRETLQAHAPTFVVPRDSSGYGTLLHWSHLLDSLLCLLALPFTAFLSQPAALHAAAVLAGPLCVAGLGYAIAWTIAPFTAHRLLWLGPVVAVLSPAVGSYAMPGVLHHHVLIIVTVVMAAGWAARIIAGVAPPRAGWALGAWAATGIWLTPEATPLLLLAFGGLWLAWVTMPARRDLAAAMRATGAAFLLVVAASFAVDPPYAGYTSVEIDRLSMLFLGLAVAVAAAGGLTLAVDRATTSFRLGQPARIAAAVLAGGFCVGAWVATFPVVLSGFDSLVSDAGWRLMMDHIVEMEPVSTFADLLRYLLTGTLAAMLLAWLAVRQRSVMLGYAALCVAGLVVFGHAHVRFAAYAATAAGVMLPVAIAEAERRLAARPELTRGLARMAVMLVFVMGPSAGGLQALFSKAEASEAHPVADCSVSGLAGMLAPYAGQVVLADVNDSPELLYRTGVETVGSLYHRNVAGFLRLRAAWRSLPSDGVPPEVAASGAALVLFCPAAQRSPLVGDLPPDTLLDRLNHGAVPPWLHQVAADPASGNVLYRVAQ
jgi:hypothetical protein